MKWQRYAIVFLPKSDLAKILIGRAAIVNLPADAEVESIDYDYRRDAVAVRISSAQFELTQPGQEFPTFDCVIAGQ